MFSDIRFALRQLAKSPGFTALAILTFALGLGATTSIFSVIHGVLLKPLEYAKPDQLVLLAEYSKRETEPSTYGTITPPSFIDWRKSAQSFSALAAQRRASVNLTGTAEPQRLVGALVTADYWQVMGTAPELGRQFTADEDHPGKDNVVVISHAFWQRQFGGTADVIGKTVQLNGRTKTIVGVMPAEFERSNGGRPNDLWTPIAFEAEDLADDNRGSHYITVFGRLKDGVTLEQAHSEVNVIEAGLVKQFPAKMGDSMVAIRPLIDVTVGEQRPVLLTLLGAVGGLLLIACVNVANLLLTRAAGRMREISVRAALGASPRRIARQLLTESLVLAVLGGLGGLVVAYGGLKALLALAPAGLPRVADVTLNLPVFLAAAGIVLVCGFGFGIAPAIQAARVNLIDAMKDGARGTGESKRRGWLRQGLVVAETALALILLVGAGLLMRSFVKLTAVNPGFEPHGAVTLNLALPNAKYPTPESRLNFVNELTRRFAALPGVTAVGVTHSMPFSGGDWVLGTAVEGRNYGEGGANQPSAGYFSVTPDYFKAMGIAVLQGRAFNAQDTAQSPHVALISQSFAAKHFPNENPLGKRIDMTNQQGVVWREIVGVVADVKNAALNQDPLPQMYEPYAQRSHSNIGVVVRASGSVTSLTPALKSEVYAIDKDQPVYRILPLDSIIADSVARERFASTLLAVFSVLALFLAVIGIYGVMTYSVAQRTPEFGVRFALGATPGNVLRLVFAGAGKLVAGGLVLGIAGALALSRLVESQLFGISARDPLTYAALSVLFLVVTALACWLPARRAAKVDPMVALRSE